MRTPTTTSGPELSRHIAGKGTTVINGQEDYNNIFMPIESAIRKANVKKSEIDYVLLIGGSAQNPFIQEELHKHF